MLGGGVALYERDLMFFLFSNRLGCGTSLLISLAISALLLLLFMV